MLFDAASVFCEFNLVVSIVFFTIGYKVRKFLLDDGFTMFQFSIYIRNCASSENAAVHIKRIKSRLPPHGKVGILCITDKQFANMELFFGAKAQKVQAEGVQLELF